MTGWLKEPYRWPWPLPEPTGLAAEAVTAMRETFSNSVTFHVADLGEPARINTPKLIGYDLASQPDKNGYLVVSARIPADCYPYMPPRPPA